METDLDLGHLNGLPTSRHQGQLAHYGPYLQGGDCKGTTRDYLAKTIQVVPHITDEFKRNVKCLA
jgi:CTP synthase